MKNKVLIVAAHPDDEVLGCGGTAALHSHSGSETNLLILSTGIEARHKNIDGEYGEEISKLRDQTRQAAEILGIERTLFLDFPDNRMDSVALLDVVKAVEEVIEQFRPNIVYTHNPADLNIDHEITARAVITATRPFPGQGVHSVYSFEVPSSTEWNLAGKNQPFSPNVFVDISSAMELKLKALEAYSSEIRTFPHPRSKEGILALSRMRGAQAGLPAAEGFKLVRSIVHSTDFDPLQSEKI